MSIPTLKEDISVITSINPDMPTPNRVVVQAPVVREETPDDTIAVLLADKEIIEPKYKGFYTQKILEIKGVSKDKNIGQF